MFQQAAIAAGVAASALCGANAPGQSTDALLNKLVEKGVLKIEEAEQLKKESDQGFNKAYQNKTGMPDWVTSLKFYGDFRGRFEQHTSENPAYSDRTRYRYRLRFGTALTLKDDFEIGFRLTSADNASDTAGGNPVSNNTTLQDNGSKKGIFIDAAYGKWTPIHNANWTASATIGKMDNPFVLSNMVLDHDYQPEGVALQGAYKFNDHHSLKFNGAVIILDELNQPTAANPSASHDPYLYGGQLLWDAKWSPKLESALSISAFNIVNKNNLTEGAVPNNSDGNSRTTGVGGGNLRYNYNPIIGGVSTTYKLDSFPGYKGQFPLRVGGEFMKNPAAPTANEGWWAGLNLGKAGKKGTWEIAYKYERLQGDAWYEELVDDDFGAFYAGVGPRSSKGGWRGGTNVKGHVVKGTYSFTDSLSFVVTYYLTEHIQQSFVPALVPPAVPISNSGHLLVDLMWKF